MVDISKLKILLDKWSKRGSEFKRLKEEWLDAKYIYSCGGPLADYQEAAYSIQLRLNNQIEKHES